MSEAQWLGNDVWDSAADNLDALNGPLGYWALTGMRPSDDRDGYSAYVYVCCGAPVEAHHLDDCPQTPIWQEMCEEYGNALHLWAFGSLREEVIPFWEIGGGLLINPRYQMEASSRWTVMGTTSGLRHLRGAEVVLDDADLTFSWNRHEGAQVGKAKPRGPLMDAPISDLATWGKQIQEQSHAFTLADLYRMRGMDDPIEVISRVLSEQLVTLAMSWLNNPTGHMIESDVETLARCIQSALNANLNR